MLIKNKGQIINTSSLTICALNCENLFLTPKCSEKLKDPKKTKELAKALLRINADIILLSEVGEFSGDLFTKDFLNGSYICSLIPGNSDRGIHLCYLIKKDFIFNWEHLTNKNKTLDFNYPSELEKCKNQDTKKIKKHGFARDVAELRLFRKNDKNPFLILLGVHLKSKIDSTGEDFGGVKRRSSEVKKLIEIYKNLGQKFKQTPIIILGDLNGEIYSNSSSNEFSPILRETKLTDILQLLKLSKEESFTHQSWNAKKRELHRIQLDYILIPPALNKKIDTNQSGVYRYLLETDLKDKNTFPVEKGHNLPSDHFPIVLSLTNLANKQELE